MKRPMPLPVTYFGNASNILIVYCVEVTKFKYLYPLLEALLVLLFPVINMLSARDGFVTIARYTSIK